MAAALVVFSLKLGAWAITGSVGLLSDALESTVNLVAALIAVIALRTAEQPADSRHHFGHGKAEYFSALAEGLMIIVAAGLIIFSAVERLINPAPLEQLGLGLAISVVASIINGAVALVLIRAGARHRSIALTADGKHLMTDVWTSVGVLVGVGLVAVTGWDVLDPVVAIAVALNIVVTGAKLMGQSADGLMDSSLSAAEHDAIVETVCQFESDQVGFHAIQTRRAGRQRFVTMHVLVPGQWTVQQGHDLLEEIERALDERLPDVHVLTHLEPREDPRSWQVDREGHHPTEEGQIRW